MNTQNDPRFQTPTSLTETFTASNLTVDRKYLTYTDAGGQERSLGYMPNWPVAGMATWMRKNITPADFFAAKAAKVPFLEILEGTGYILPHIRRWMKAEGLNWKSPADRETFTQLQARG